MFKFGTDLIFEKSYQDFLKKKYFTAISKYWDNDEKMVKFEMNKIAYLVPICEGKYIICIDKAKLNTDFFFGYSDIGQGFSYEENNKRIDEFKKNLSSNFKESNLSNIDSMIEELESIFNGHSSKTAMHFKAYFNDGEDTILHELGFDDPWRGKTFSGEGYKLENNDLSLLIEAYKKFKEYTSKKIDTYLKKYGTSKMSVHSYWVDR